MERVKYTELTKGLENYFAKIIKKRFKEYVEENNELSFVPDYLSHIFLDDLLRNDGFDVYGMNTNSDGFQLLLNFNHHYLAIDNFPFTRLSVNFENNGNYSIFLSKRSFDDEWTVNLEDEYLRYLNFNEVDFTKTLSDIKNTHLMLVLKS